MRFASIQCNKMRLRLRPAGALTALPRLTVFKGADSRRGGEGGKGREVEREERSAESDGKGWGVSWNRAADWLRPVLGTLLIFRARIV